MLMLLTPVSTETPFLVIIKVACCTAPQLAVTSALSGAGVVLFAKEGEGEVTGLALRISTRHSGV